LYVCILSQEGNTLLHQECPARADALLKWVTPWLDDLVVGVECMHCWYGSRFFSQAHGIHFILGHALYMHAIHGGKAKNNRIDSLKIAQLMRGGNFPPAYVSPCEMTCCAAGPIWSVMALI
jgi:transposase